MKTFIQIFTVFVTLPLMGCASLLSSVTDRAIMSDRLNSKGKDPKRLKSMVGDRRVMRVIKLDQDGNVPKDQRILICPEPFSGAVIARGTKDNIAVTKFGSTDNETTQTAVPVDQRGEVVRLYEDQSAWLCFHRASGDLDQAAYMKDVKALNEAAFNALTVPKEPAGSGPAKNTPAKAGADKGTGAPGKK